MVKLPMSDYVCNYYKEQGIEFAFRQQAHFCWTYNDLLKDKLDSLRDILAVSDDEKLNTEIRERLEYEKKAYRNFMGNLSPGCIYLVHPNDKEEHCDGYFSSAPKAVSYGKRNCAEGYKIIKRYLRDQCPVGFLKGEEPDGCNTILSAYDFTSDGEVRYGYSYEYPLSFDEEDESRFENMFLNIRSPFGLGDIVMGEGFDCPGVVASDHDCFEKIYDRHKKDMEIYMDDTDNCIRTDCISKDGLPDYDHISPFGLWKVDSWDDKEYWDILKFMGNAVKQGVDLLHFDHFVHEYCRHHKGEDTQKAVRLTS